MGKENGGKVEVNHSVSFGSNMRILHISKYYYPYIGGVENTCKYLADSFSETDDVAVVCFNESSQNVKEKVGNVTVYRVGTWINIARQALSLAYFPILRKAIGEFKPDIIHFHWANPYPAAVLLTMIPQRVKLVVHWHMDIIKQKKIYPFIRPIETALLKRADKILVTSPNYRECSLPLQLFKAKVDVVQSAIEEDSFKKKDGDEDRIRQIKEKYSNKPIVFFVGRHIQYKGLPYLIEAERRVTADCVFVIAGKGPLTEELRSSCKSERVKFVGKVSDDDLRCYLYASTILAFPSITKNEAFGLSLAQGMYCKCPAVTFSIEGSGVNWVSVKDQTCIEAPNGDVAAYAKGIDALIKDKQLHDKLAEAGYERAKSLFVLPKEIEACKKSYASIM